MKIISNSEVYCMKLEHRPLLKFLVKTEDYENQQCFGFKAGKIVQTKQQ